MDRIVLRVSGPDRAKFLHGLITRDVPAEGLGYAALLSPQGKYLADFLTFDEGSALHLDVAAALAEGLARRLAMYRLRSKVEIADAGLRVTRGTGAPPEGALADPRPGMGWRRYGPSGESGDADATDWDALRVEHLVPETGIELVPDDSYILEMGFERLNGVDFRKGCYVGQEVTARMKHKTELRKGLARVRGTGLAPGLDIVSDGRAAGIVHTVAGDRALAYLRYDRAGAMTANDVPLALDARAL